MADNFEQHLRDLDEQNKALKAENERLKEHTEDALLLGLVADSTSLLDLPDSILSYTLERIALLKDVPFCAFCELLDDEAFILSSYSTFPENHSPDNRIVLSEKVIEALMDEPRVFSGDDIHAQGITIKLDGSAFIPQTVLIIPFSSRLIHLGILLLAGSDFSQDRFSQQITPLNRVLEIIISRLDNLSLVQELQHLNVALNMEVDQRVGELRETNEQLREAMLQRLQVEDALLRQRDLIANISEVNPVGITITDKNGQITYANDRAQAVLGLTKSQITGRQYNASEWKITDYAGDQFPEDELPFVKVMATGQSVYNLRHAIEWPDGERVLLAINAAPLYDDDFHLDGVVAVVEDVTEQVAADAEFRRLQNFNTSIVQNISEGIVVQNQAGEFTFVNPATANILGYSPEEIRGRHWKEVIPPDQHAIVETADERRKQGKADHYELELQRKDGRRIPVRVSGSPRIDIGSGDFLGSLAVFTDITERKKAERLLQQRVDQLALINDIGEKIAAVLDLESVLRRTARLIQESFDYEHVALFIVDRAQNSVILKTVSGDFEQLFPPTHTLKLGQGLVGTAALENKTVLVNNVESDPRYINFYQDVIHTRAELSVPIQVGREVVGVIDAQSVKLNAFDESDVMVMETLADQVAVAIHNANLHEAVQRELDERKQAEDALRRSENTLSSIFRAAPTGIGLVSKHKLVQVNQRICEMIGYSQEELIGQNARIIYPTDEDYEYVGREKYRQIQEFGTGTVETRWQHKDGQIIDVLMSSTPIDPDDWSTGVTFTSLDITERKQAEARIQRQLHRLAALNQIDAAITGNLSLDRTIDILLEQTVRQLNVDAAAILRYKPPTQTLEYYAGQGFNTEAIKAANVRLGQGFAGRAALERHIIHATDAEPVFLSCHQFAAEGFRCYYGVPLTAKGQIKGVLEIFHRSLLEPTESWINFLETLARQAAIAIESAELVENLERSNLELRLAYNTTLEGWAKALELRDFETQGHSHRVTELTIHLASDVGIPNNELVHVQRGALLHDIGKMAISDSILLKPGPLDDAEWEIMRQHPVYAYEMLTPIEFLRPALDIPYYHHEKWDGSGYPHGLKGKAIPLAARVFAIIDVWDALSSDRPYRPAWSQAEVLEHIHSQVGKHFDPRVAEAFFAIIQRE